MELYRSVSAHRDRYVCRQPVRSTFAQQHTSSIVTEWSMAGGTAAMEALRQPYAQRPLISKFMIYCRIRKVEDTLELKTRGHMTRSHSSGLFRHADFALSFTSEQLHFNDILKGICGSQSKTRITVTYLGMSYGGRLSLLSRRGAEKI